MSRLESVWIVTTPRKGSQLADIVFRATPIELIRQVRGGLSESEEPTFYDNEADARAEGTRRLEAYKVYRAVLDGKEGDAR